MTTDRLPPNSPEAERGVLGCLLFDAYDQERGQAEPQPTRRIITMKKTTLIRLLLLVAVGSSGGLAGRDSLEDIAKAHVKAMREDGSITNVVKLMLAEKIICDVRGHQWAPGCGMDGCLVMHSGCLLEAFHRDSGYREACFGRSGFLEPQASGVRGAGRLSSA